MDLRRILLIARHWLLGMVLAAIVSGAVAYGITMLQPRMFEARTTVLVGQALSVPDPDYNQLLVAQNLATTYAVVAETRPTLDRLIDRLDLPLTPEQLAERISVEVRTDDTLLTVAVQDGDPARAAAIANGVAAELVDVSPAIEGDEVEVQRSLEADLQATRDLIAETQAAIDVLTAAGNRTVEQEAELASLTERIIELRSTYATLRSFASGSTNVVTVLDPAAAPLTPVSPRPLLSAALAAAVGFFGVLGLAILLAQRDLMARRREDAIGYPRDDDSRSDNDRLSASAIDRHRASAQPSALYLDSR